MVSNRGRYLHVNFWPPHVLEWVSVHVSHLYTQSNKLKSNMSKRYLSAYTLFNLLLVVSLLTIGGKGWRGLNRISASPFSSL